jgi:hypothetical protein
VDIVVDMGAMVDAINRAPTFLPCEFMYIIPKKNAKMQTDVDKNGIFSQISPL